jgi:succinate dehydrogenase / fumarate reductase membrane anchor subunit
MNATKHWWSQRLSAILLIPLTYWLLDFLRHCFQKNYFETIEWLALPFNKIALIAWIITVFYHAALGVQIILEDYVSHQQKRFIAIWSANTVFATLALGALVLLF